MAMDPELRPQKARDTELSWYGLYSVMQDAYEPRSILLVSPKDIDVIEGLWWGPESKPGLVVSTRGSLWGAGRV